MFYFNIYAHLSFVYMDTTALFQKVEELLCPPRGVGQGESLKVCKDVVGLPWMDDGEEMLSCTDFRIFSNST